MRRNKGADSRAVTLQEVALRAGVSIYTVSSVLSQKEGARISAGTRERVMQIAAEMGYHPHALASSLRRRSTQIIGFHTTLPFNPLRDLFMGALVQGVYRGAALAGKRLMLNLAPDQAEPDAVSREITNGFLDGLILHCHERDPLAALLAASKVTTIAVVEPTDLLPCVVTDEADGSRLLADHLAERGHRRVIYRRSHIPYRSAETRYAAFAEAAQARGIVIEETWDHETGVSDPLRDWRTNVTPEERDWLHTASPDRPTAFVGWNDYPAFQMLLYCRWAGIAVPERLAIAGFGGDTRFSDETTPLTTIYADWGAVAETAVDLLARAISGVPPPPLTTMPVKLIRGMTS